MHHLSCSHQPVRTGSQAHPRSRRGELSHGTPRWEKCQGKSSHGKFVVAQGRCSLGARRGSMQCSQTIMLSSVRNFLDTIEAFGYPVVLG